jgi:phosphatidylcholine synthase
MLMLTKRRENPTLFTTRNVMPPPASARAFAVHVFTASGAALALLALLAAVDGRWTAMFLWLGAALIVDGLDGAMARRFQVAELLPRWSGDVLDLVVDFLTYVFVPAYAIIAGGLLPGPLAVPAGIAIVITGALYFADREMKTADNFFRGFPALWNLVAFYLFVLRPPSWFAAAVVALLLVLTFAPFKFVHPVRVRRWRVVSIAAVIAWAVLAMITVWHDLAPGRWVAVGLVIIALYILGVGLADQMSKDRAPSL